MHRIKYFWSVFLYLGVYLLGISPAYAQTMGLSGKTRAVVIGVSDYQDDRIPDLKFAHRDAEAFVKYLQSTSGGALAKEDIRLLTNEAATAGQIFGALDWLITESKEGDKVIVYFSGHGDVETKTIRQRGYLLAHDTPANNYRVGAVGLEDINDILATLSELNKAEIVLITDACHSGQLAGNSIKGTQATATALMNQFAKEVKIMSCQPNEFSQEGEQWGGGRGVFSYHLVEGLVGMADRNTDEQVSLREIERYLEDEVSKEAAPAQQTPLVFGNKMSTLTYVDTDALAALKNKKSQEIETIAVVGTRTSTGMALLHRDSNAQVLYAAFQRALRQKNFLPSDRKRRPLVGPSASELYDTLVRINTLRPLRATMKRNFAAALQDESQQAIIAYLRTDPEELDKRYKINLQAYDRHPAYLAKACKLLGEDHYLYKKLLAKQYYFDALVMRLQAERFSNTNYYERADSLAKIALSHDDQAAFIHNELGLIQLSAKKFRASIPHFNQALELAPTWFLPRLNLTDAYTNIGQFERADSIGKTIHELDKHYIPAYLNRARIFKWKENKVKQEKVLLDGLQANPNSADLNGALGLFYSMEEKYDQAKLYLDKALVLDSLNVKYLNNLASLYLDSDDLDWRAALPILQKVIDLDSTNYFAQFNTGFWYSLDGQHQKAIDHYKKKIQLIPGESDAYVYMAYEQMYLNQFAEAKQTINLIESIFPGNMEAAYGKACWHSLQDQFAEAIPHLEKAIQQGIDLQRIEGDADLRMLRRTDEYKALVARLFPE